MMWNSRERFEEQICRRLVCAWRDSSAGYPWSKPKNPILATVFSSGQLEQYETAEAENEVHVAKYAGRVEVAWAATVIVSPPRLAFERLGAQTELDHDSGSVSTEWSVCRVRRLWEVHFGLAAASTRCAEGYYPTGTTRFDPVYEMPCRLPASCYHNGHAGCRLTEGCRTKDGVRRASHRGTQLSVGGCCMSECQPGFRK